MAIICIFLTFLSLVMFLKNILDIAHMFDTNDCLAKLYLSLHYSS
jgi:hypothetical protein